MIYEETAKGGYKMPSVFDPNSIISIGIIYKPDTWVSSKVYYFREDDDYDICVPSIFNGFYYRVSIPGVSGTIEPLAWSTIPGGTTQDGTITWVTVPYNLLVPGISILTSSWSVTGQASVWTVTTSHAVGDIIQTTASGDQFICSAITTGLTGGTQPTWNIGSGSKTIDAGVTWTYLQSIPFISSSSFNNGTTNTLLNGGPNLNVTGVTITNTITKSDGTKDDISIYYKIANR